MRSSGALYTFAPSAARTANGNSDVEQFAGEAMAVTLDVTAASGTTPSLTVVVEDAPTQNGPWTQLAAFAAQTAIGTNVQRITNSAIHSYVRARWTVSGTTPSFTFSLQATAR